MIVVPVSSSVGPYEPFYIRVVRESKDAPGSYPFTICIRDLRGNLVLSRSFTYDSAREVATFAVDVSALGEGVYRVHIYNWTDCSPPSNTPAFVYWLHRFLDEVTLSFEGWNYSRMYVFVVYRFDWKLFWKYLVNTSDVAVPRGATVYIEASDGSGNAFVGSVVASGGVVYVRPNTAVPFMAVFRVKYQDRVARDVMGAFGALSWLMRDVYVKMVDDYTVEIGIVKTEPGAKWLLVAAITVPLAGGFIAWTWYDSRVREIELERKRLEYVKPLVDGLADVVRTYRGLLSGCSPNDLECIMQVERAVFPAVQSISSLIGLLLQRGFPLTGCDGINVGGVCVPWWVVAVAVFLAGLLVISAVR